MTETIEERMRNGTFWSLPRDAFLKVIHAGFSNELDRLRRAPSATERTRTPDGIATGVSSPSQVLFGKDHDEVNRTLCSILATKWIWEKDYKAFTLNQDSGTRLSIALFQALADFMRGTASTVPKQLLVVVLLMIHDLGKDSSLANEITTNMGGNTGAENHDEVIFEAVRRGLIPCVSMLKAFPREQRGLLLCLQASARLNIGQLIQAENVPGSLKPVAQLFGGADLVFFDIKFIEFAMDLAGVRGHVSHDGAQILTQPNVSTLIHTHAILKNVARGKIQLTTAYDAVLHRRAEDLLRAGFKWTVNDDQVRRALLRIFMMSRTTGKTQANLLVKAGNALPRPLGEELVLALNVTGCDEDGKAIIPYYMPALFSCAFALFKGDTTENHRVAVLASLLRFLARALQGTRPHKAASEVIEVNLLFAKSTILSEAFHQDPSVLDKLDFPQATCRR
ncbi:hypothetical protein CAC42_2865 [Sphaceloma murrayae]|uniref:Uncharacterized protein n=1 Tax=Sphaceloma murrayae TaxID=2082308 RepID=A0A2K1R0V5_9PEZI|nr:hypothetical protein CAC42_2865 [Sphaceloma murrayae]